MKRTDKRDSVGGNAGLAMSVISMYAKELRRFLGRRARQRWEVDDLAQEVYLRLLKVDPHEVHKPLEFTLGIARHVLVDRLRTDLKKQNTFPLVGDAQELLKDEASVALEDRLEECLSVRQELVQVLSQLPPTQAAALVLFHREGLTYEEIARKFGLSPQTVHTYIRDARRQVRMMHWADPNGVRNE